MDISFIIPNYRSEKFLKNCLLSLKQNLKNILWEVIIVNNDFCDLKKSDYTDFQNFHIFNREINDGFASACNFGARNASGKIYFFLNPDTELKKIDAKKILNVFESNNDTGIIAPKILMSNGDVQPWSCGCETNLIDIIKNNLGIIKSKELWTKNISTEVDWVSGCALAISASCFEDLSGFDENFFMYFEDADLCKRTRYLGKRVVFMPEMQILHLGGKSFSNSVLQKKYYHTSQDYYFKKHRGLIELFLLKKLRSIILFFEK